jgi:hypothetical protein
MPVFLPQILLFFLEDHQVHEEHPDEEAKLVLVPVLRLGGLLVNVKPG